MVVKTAGDATPVVLCEKAGFALPEWSRDGQWIKFVDARAANASAGWALSSPDGKTLRSYGEPNTIDMTFSADSKRLYGIRVEADRRTLFSLDIATKEVKDAYQGIISRTRSTQRGGKADDFRRRVGADQRQIAPPSRCPRISYILILSVGCSSNDRAYHWERG